MKAKKWLTIITFIISIVSLILVFIIGKDSNSISYDIVMAMLGSAILGCIMSIIEYFTERRKAMEEFYLQSLKILKELRKIEYINIEPPAQLIINALQEENNNNYNKQLKKIIRTKAVEENKAKNDLISWYKENNVFPFNQNNVSNEEIEKEYELKINEYKEILKKHIDIYSKVSLIETEILGNSYNNLDFLFINKVFRKKVAYDTIYDKIRIIVDELKKETIDFKLLEEQQGNFVVCSLKVMELNQKYFNEEKVNESNCISTRIYSQVFDDIDNSLEKFRSKIYYLKFTPIERRYILGKIKLLKDDKAE